MRKVIDLSQKIYDDMPVHPYDGAVKVHEDRVLEKDKYNNTRADLSMHSGTHIDAPRHFLDIDKYICDYEIDRFIGDGCLLDARGESSIGYKEEYDKLVKEGDIVLLYTGFGGIYGSKDYYEGLNNQPVVEEELADFFIERKIKILGMDTPSPDKYPFNIHKKLFKNEIFIIENMTNLEKLIGIPKFEVIALPLKIMAEASIIRAIARY